MTNKDKMQRGVEKALASPVMEGEGCGEAAGFAAGKVGLGQRVRDLKGEWSLLLWVTDLNPYVVLGVF